MSTHYTVNQIKRIMIHESSIFMILLLWMQSDSVLSEMRITMAATILISLNAHNESVAINYSLSSIVSIIRRACPANNNNNSQMIMAIDG